ncbi:hypothetical protein BDV95DRAFT_114385 [Massariosphaeria phaeospora]|uniref:Uncharacterized protein n=1 Tax=Massariosphaeria phaeospora TaxID=100035 RepID=A0A7C8I2K4_9PLEO|nr:hypothetical protein BDV95DRAFT_114385 [Massariosphaeria phaeospora]
MAPSAQPRPGENGSNGSTMPLNSLSSWLQTYGTAEYALYKKGHATPHLTYDDWASSEHVLGPYLYYTTLDVWEEDTSSDDEPELEPVKPVPPVPKAHPVREPKKTVRANGDAKPLGRISATPSANAKTPEPAPSARKRRRSKKKFLSEETVASDDSEDVDRPTSSAAAAVKPGRKQRKKQYLVSVLLRFGLRTTDSAQSAEIIAPEDMEDSIPEDEHEEPAPAVQTLVVLSPRTTVSPQIQKKMPLSKETVDPEDMDEPLYSRPNHLVKKKKVLSKETVDPEDMEDEEEAAPVSEAVSEVATTPASAVAASSVPASPDGASTSSAPRRGLRVRTPAQQRPYFHHAKLFEEAESTEQVPNDNGKPLLKPPTTKLAQVSYPDEDEDMLDIDDDIDESSGMQPEQEVDDEPKQKAKGKAKVWKRDDEEDDHDFASPRVKPQPGELKRARGRPRKYNKLSDEQTQIRTRTQTQTQTQTHIQTQKLPEPAPKTPLASHPTTTTTTTTTRNPPLQPRPSPSHHPSQTQLQDPLRPRNPAPANPTTAPLATAKTTATTAMPTTRRAKSTMCPRRSRRRRRRGRRCRGRCRGFRVGMGGRGRGRRWVGVRMWRSWVRVWRA